VLTLSGAPTCGSGQQELVLREVWRSSPQAPLRCPLYREVDVCIHSLDTAVYGLVLYSIRCQRCPTVKSCCLCWDGTPCQAVKQRCPAACALLQRTPWLAYYRPSSRAQRRDGTVCSPCTVHGDTTRRLQIRQAYRGVSLPAPCVSGRPHFLTWARPAQLPHLMLVGGLETREGPSAAGTWQGQPRSLYRTARGGTGPLPGGRRVRALEADRSGLACDGPAITRSGPGPLGSPAPRGQPESPPALLGAQRPRTS
jgi:hypothetical protein